MNRTLCAWIVSLEDIEEDFDFDNAPEDWVKYHPAATRYTHVLGPITEEMTPTTLSLLAYGLFFLHDWTLQDTASYWTLE